MMIRKRLNVIFIFASLMVPIDDTESFEVKVVGAENRIRNSNGNWWDPLVENIQPAIDDVVASERSGTVWLPPETFNIPSQMGESGYSCGIMLPSYAGYRGTVKEGVTLDMGGATFIPTGNFNVVELGKRASIRNGYIQVGPVSGFSKALLFLDGKQYHDGLGRHTTIYRMDLSACDHSPFWDPVCPYKGKGIHLFCDNSRGNQAIGFVNVDDIHSLGLEYDVMIQNLNSLSAWINANMFSNLFFAHSKNNIYITRNTGISEVNCATSGNIFNNIQVQANTAWVAMRGVQETCIRADGWGNIFSNLMLWDWSHSSGPAGKTAVELTADTRATYLMGRGFGSWLVDNGASAIEPNTILDYNRSELKVKKINNCTMPTC